MSYTPKNHSAVPPYLIVPDADRLLKFFKVVFSAKETFVMRNERGKIQHGEVRIEDVDIMFANSTDTL